MNAAITVARLDKFASDGTYDTTIYEVRVEEDDVYQQDIQLSSIEELVMLRDTLTSYLSCVNNNHPDHEHETSD